MGSSQYLPSNISPAAQAAQAAKKKGLKSSLGRFFSKKEKVSNSILSLIYNSLQKLKLNWCFKVTSVSLH